MPHRRGGGLRAGRGAKSCAPAAIPAPRFTKTNPEQNMHTHAQGEEQRRLSWDDATERMLVAAFSPQTTSGDGGGNGGGAAARGPAASPAASKAPRGQKIGAALSGVTWKAYNSLLGIEFIRRAVGAGRNTKVAPLFGETEEAERMQGMELYPQGCY